MAFSEEIALQSGSDRALAQRRSLAQASRPLSAKRRCASAQQKHLACFARLGKPAGVVDESVPEAIGSSLPDAANDFPFRAQRRNDREFLQLGKPLKILLTEARCAMKRIFMNFALHQFLQPQISQLQADSL